MSHLVTLSVPRTGSSHLTNHLRAFTGLRVFGEVFNPRQCFSLKSGHFEYIAERWGQILEPDIADPGTVDWVRTHPTEMFEVFSRFGGDRCTTVKLFPSHLDRDFVTGDLLPRDDVVALILVRRVIDSYASAAKARRTNRWRVADTTDLRVEGDIDEFVSWARFQQRWYTDCVDALRSGDRPVNVMRYEADVDRDTEEILAGLERMLRANGIDPGPRKDIPWVTGKQDGSPDHTSKFRNWPEFREQLDDADMLELATGYFV